ncbi:histone-lysine N-methyltransferase PRDM9-like isoform X1 [Clavelina lepadiformis]|uniref:histone-lysine N-methyltransferase PRDM9-like isoform X1 n=1 Tax=Clavelina lepadiformis TaxID=159417 RepID=UPI004041E696
MESKMETNDESEYEVVEDFDQLRLETNIKERVVYDEDDYLYCDDCEERWVGDCPTHGPYLQVFNSLVNWGLPNRALGTCPQGISIGPSRIRPGGDGAWADIDFPKNTVFGPYEGEYIDQQNRQRLCPSYEGGYSWGIYKNGLLSHYIDGDDVKTSSWLRYVNCTRDEEEQNVKAYQYQGKIYFRAIKNISSKSEIAFWYEEKYAELLGVATIKSKRRKVEAVSQRTEPSNKNFEKYETISSNLKAVIEGSKSKHTERKATTRYRCKFCQFSTGRPIELKRHMLNHTQ